MKKIIKNLIVLILFNFISSNIFAATLIKTNEFVVNKHLKITLSEGEWYLVSRKGDSYYGLNLDSYDLARVQNNRVVELIFISDFDVAGIYESYVNEAIQEIYFTNKYDGCYERPEYYLQIRYKRGNSLNCLTVQHIDTDKELNNPDDPEMRGAFAQVNKWINNNNYDLPKIMLNSEHNYFSRLVRGELAGISYSIDPKILNSPSIQNFREEDSEFHKYNIENYPKHKKIMEKWVSIAAKRHQIFERNHRAKKKHLLNLDKYISNDNSSDNKSNIVENLKKLNDLYKSGVLTKEEFEKAKKKLLN